MKTKILFVFLFLPIFCFGQCDSTDFSFLRKNIEHYGWLVHCTDSAFVKIKKSTGGELYVPPLPKQKRKVKFISAGSIYVQIKIGSRRWQYYYGEKAWVKAGYYHVNDIH